MRSETAKRIQKKTSRITKLKVKLYGYYKVFKSLTFKLFKGIWKR